MTNPHHIPASPVALRTHTEVRTVELEERVIHLLLQDKIRERNIPTSAIKKWTDLRLSLYIASIAIEQSGDTDLDRERGLFLLRHTIK